MVSLFFSFLCLQEAPKNEVMGINCPLPKVQPGCSHRQFSACHKYQYPGLEIQYQRLLT